MRKLTFDVHGAQVGVRIPDHLSGEANALARMCKDAILEFEHQRQIREIERDFLLSVSVS